jgi:hypothetical protein
MTQFTAKNLCTFILITSQLCAFSVFVSKHGQVKKQKMKVLCLEVHHRKEICSKIPSAVSRFIFAQQTTNFKAIQKVT